MSRRDPLGGIRGAWAVSRKRRRAAIKRVRRARAIARDQRLTAAARRGQAPAGARIRARASTCARVVRAGSSPVFVAGRRAAAATRRMLGGTRRRRALVLTPMTLVLVSLLMSVAFAAWSLTGSGFGSARADTVDPGQTPTVTVSNRSVELSWAGVTFSDGHPIAGYIVKRYNTSNDLQTIGAGCSGTQAGTSCTETAVPAGTWKYAVMPVHHNWTGDESATNAVVVEPPTLSLTNTNINSLPRTLTGSITRYVQGETVTYRLDDPTSGQVLSGSITPSPVPASGSASVSVTVPTGVSQGQHTIYAIGSSGVSTASDTFVYDSIAPSLTSLQGFDVNANGKVDRVVATFNETLASYTAGNSPWSMSNAPSGATLNNVSVTGNQATLNLNEGSGSATTAMSGFVVSLSSNANGIRDAHGNRSSFSSQAVADKAAPAALTMEMRDNDSDAKVDRVVITWSESLASYTAGNAPWTLANVPSAGTLNNVTGTTTLNITEGPGAPDTGVGSFTVALAEHANGIRDAAGNRTSFGPTAPTDKATPRRQRLDMFDVDTDGKVDRVEVEFSEAIVLTTGTGKWSLDNVPSNGSLGSESAAGAVVTLGITEGTGSPDTSVDEFTVKLDPDAVADAAGNKASFGETAPADKAAPARLSMTMQDNDTDGLVDRVSLTFSESLSSYSAGTAPWTLANVPSGGTLSSVSVSSPNVTLTIAEGAGAKDTAVGAFTIALAASATGIRDSAGNLTSWGATAPSDGAAPLLLSIADDDTLGDASDGLFEDGDWIEFFFSETIAQGVPSQSAMTLRDPSGSGNDTLSIGGMTNGNRDTGSNGYVGQNNSTASRTSNNSAPTSTSIRVTAQSVGCFGTGCGTLAKSSGTLSLQLSSALKDAAGNAVTGTLTVPNYSLF